MEISLSNLHKICRACMCADKQLESIFDFKINSFRVCEMFAYTLARSAIQPTNNLPNNICSSCLDKLIVAYEFQQMCISSESHIQNVIEHSNTEGKFIPIGDCNENSKLAAEDPLDTDNEASAKGIKLELIEDENSPSANVMNSLEEKTEVTNYLSIGNERDLCWNDTTDLTKKKGWNSPEDNQKNLSVNPEPEARSSIEKPDPRNRRRGVYPCSICGKILNRQAHLKRHMNIHISDGKSFECSQCKHRFKTEICLKRHEVTHSSDMQIIKGTKLIPQSYMCPECPRCFEKQESLSAHMRIHRVAGDNKLYNCDFCSKQFDKLNRLTRHLKTHGNKKEFKCNLCDKLFARNDMLINHLNNHNGFKPHVCHYCNKAFQQSSTLKDHLRTHTGEQPYLCSECGKAFNSSSNLRQHIIRHTGIKKYQCTQCPSKFPCLSDLASHMATHMTSKPYICDVCSAGFTKPYLLKKHKRYHTGEKPYKCDYCEMRFVCSDQAKRHMRTHTGEKPYSCKYCERAFSQSNDLVKHLRTHIGENIYKCDQCDLSFRLLSELKDHSKKHYKKEGTDGDTDATA